MSWAHENAGFFYSRYPTPAGGTPMLSVNHDHKLYYHKPGTDQAQDRLVYERPDHPDWGIGASVTEDGRYAVLTLWLGTDRRHRVAYNDLKDAPHPDRPATPAALPHHIHPGFRIAATRRPR